MPTKGTERAWEKKPEAKEKLSEKSLDELLVSYRKIFDEGYRDVAIITGEDLIKQLLELNQQMEEKSKKLGLTRPEEKGKSVQEKKMMALLLMNDHLEPLRQEIIQRVYHPKQQQEPFISLEAHRILALDHIQKSLAGGEFTDVILLADLTNEEFKRQQDLMLEQWADGSHADQLKANCDAIQNGTRQKGMEKIPTEQESAFMTYVYQELQKGGAMSKLLGSGEIKSLDAFVASKPIRDGYERFLEERHLSKDLFLSPQPGWYENLCRRVNIEERLHTYEITELRNTEELKKNPRFQKVMDGQEKDGWRRFVPFFTNNRSDMVSDDVGKKLGIDDPNRYGSLADFGFNSIHFEGRNFYLATGLANLFEPIGRWASSWVPVPGNAFNTNLDKVMWGGVKVWSSTGFLLNVLPAGVTTGRHVSDAFWKTIKGDFSGAFNEILGWSENHGEALLSDLFHSLNGQALTAFGMMWLGTSDPEKMMKTFDSWTADKKEYFLKAFREWRDRDRKSFFTIETLKAEAGDLWNKGPEGLRKFLWSAPKGITTDEMLLTWRGPEWIELRKWPGVTKEDVDQIQEHLKTLSMLDAEMGAYLKSKKYIGMPRLSEHPSLEKFDDFLLGYKKKREELLAKDASAAYQPVSFDQAEDIGLVSKTTMLLIKKSKELKNSDQQKFSITPMLGEKIMKRAAWIEKRGTTRYF